jgi:hypothetical protein
MRPSIRLELGHRFPVSVRDGFDYITDQTRWPEYWPGFVGIEPGSRWRDPGDRTRLRLRMLARTVELEMTLERIEPYRTVEYRSEQRGLPPAAHERHFAEAPDGFDYRMVVEYVPRSGLRGVFDRIALRRAVKRTMGETIENLSQRFDALSRESGEGGIRTHEAV